MIGKPKPTKQQKQKRVSAASERKTLDRQIDKLCREITHWRDGLQCVLRHLDGGHCSDVIQWSHVIAQGSSKFLQQSLSNAFDTCSSHNIMHNGAPILYLNWYAAKFGKRALEMLEAERLAHYGKWAGFTIVELRERKEHYERLYEERRYVDLNIFTLVSLGYYGEIIKEAWIKDGRI